MRKKSDVYLTEKEEFIINGHGSTVAVEEPDSEA